MQDTTLIEVRLRCVGMEYYGVMDQYLINLGLYNIATMRSGSGRIDPSLIHGLVERWRPETHTFHLPFGEMTVTLQNVSALWGLPVIGTPVSGISDSHSFASDIERLLGADPDHLRGRRGTSTYHMQMTRLREHFRGGLTPTSTPEEIQR